MNDNTTPFIGGFVGAGFSSMSIWDNTSLFLAATPMELFYFYGSKLLATVFFGIAGGFFATITKKFGEDCYKYFKTKFKKK